ncbi:MAG: hypothetical protein QXN08_08815 [Nitrososphaerales archaeon]
MEDSHACTVDRVEEAWVEVLSQMFAQAVPKLFSKTKRSWIDVFEHRLEFSKYEEDVPSVLQTLGNRLNIQGLNVPLDKVEYLKTCNDLALDVLRRWTKYLALKSYEKWRSEKS